MKVFDKRTIYEEITNLVLKLLTVIPFGFYFISYDKINAKPPNLFKLILCLARMLRIKELYYVFFGINVKYIAITFLLAIIYSFFIFAHLISAIFIILGKYG